MKLIEFVGLLVFIGAVVYFVMVKPVGAGSVSPPTAEEIRRKRAEARWEVDDTGTTDDGQVEVAIQLVAPDVAEPYGRRVVGTFTPPNYDVWIELRGRADAMARELNDRIDQR